MTSRSASMPGARPVRAPDPYYDVAILGGGLAGLTLALQLKRARPDTRVLVAEKRGRRAPEATFKVGESSSESASHYFREVLGLADHLNNAQLRKLGLRFFFHAGDNSDITQRVEFATPLNPNVFSYQLDRGRLENELWERAVGHGAHAIRACRVREVELGDEEHKVVIEREDGKSPVAARWVVDATGRGNLLRRQLEIGTDTDHTINAAWFRLGGGLDVEQWSDDQEWLDRMPEQGLRRHSTIQLTGEGYWVWLIQLASGPISIGVCADPRFHRFDALNEFDRMLAWLGEHEPQLAAEVSGRRDQVQDFLVVEDFSYGCERVYSTDRWCLTGEAGVFIDPLYSPGSDFIGYSNTFITDLVVRDLAGEDIEDRLEFYNYFFFYGLVDPVSSLYQDQYRLLGSAQVMAAKAMFNTLGYWSVLSNMFVHDKFTDVHWLAAVLPELERVLPVIPRMEAFFREWDRLDRREWTGSSTLSTEFRFIRDRQADLVVPFDGEALRERIIANVDYFLSAAVILFHKAAELLPEKPAEDVPINAQGISLRPESWEEEGLFEAPGITLAEARDRLPGIEEYFLDTAGAPVPAA